VGSIAVDDRDRSASLGRATCGISDVGNRARAGARKDGGGVIGGL